MEDIRGLKSFPLKEIGSLEWFVNQQRITTLHQSISSQMKDGDMSMTARLIQEEGKTVVILHELIALDEWKRHVLTRVKKQDNLKQVFPIYSILFSESVCSSVLLSVMYCHENDLANMFEEEVLYELADHCVQHIVLLIGLTNKKSPIDLKSHLLDDSLSTSDRIDRFESDLLYQVCNVLLSVLRLLVDHLDDLSLSLLTRLVQHHDLAVLLVHLVDNEAWSGVDVEGNEMKYNDTWGRARPEDRLVLGKYEAQTWKMLLDLLMHPKCAEMYEISTFRKNELLKLEKHLHEIIIDQFPALGCFRAWFAQVKMTNGRKVASKPLIYEMDTNSLRSKFQLENFEKVAENTTRMINNIDYLREVAAKHSDVYVNFEKASESPACSGPGRACGACEGRAKFKCSRCKLVWYCGKTCQMKHWADHKKYCSV